MLKGKVALISGATSGMGRAFLNKLASQGAAIIFNGLPSKTESIQDLQKYFKSQNIDFFYHNANMRNPSEIKNMVEEGVKKFGKIDILLNNAGIIFPPCPFFQTPIESITEMIQINLLSHIYMTHAVIPIMIKSQWGRIINISSTAGLNGFAKGSVYSATKHALVGLTKSWALELAENNITVNAVCPKFVETAMTANFHPDPKVNKVISETIISGIPTKKSIKSEDVAELVYFLCGECTKNITGATYTIDGGFTAQ